MDPQDPDKFGEINGCPYQHVWTNDGTDTFLGWLKPIECDSEYEFVPMQDLKGKKICS